MNRTTSLLVAALLAAFTLSHQLHAQSTNVKTRNTNQSTKLKSGIFKGSGNLIQSNATASFIGGGQSNVITLNGTNAVIGGGFGNSAAMLGTIGGGMSNNASGYAATVGGGQGNAANSGSATVAGGEGNIAGSAAATVGGGEANNASGEGSTIAGGWLNSAGLRATVGGGERNTASVGATTVSGGVNNAASGTGATVGGGAGNDASGIGATVGGGEQNTASGVYATVPGGIAGRATHDFSFVWSGDNGEFTDSFGNNTFTVRAEGGARFYTANGTATGVSLAAGGGAWNNLSDRAAKSNFQTVNVTEVLAKVAAMPVMTWNYKTQHESIRHIGPTAQDFRSAFGLGDNDNTISTIDPSGVALAAIQGLVEEIKLRDGKIAQLEARGLEQRAESQTQIEDLKSELRAIRERLANLPPQ